MVTRGYEAPVLDSRVEDSDRAGEGELRSQENVRKEIITNGMHYNACALLMKLYYGYHQ